MSIQLELRVTTGTPIYRGHDHYWSVIREIGKAGALFTRREVFGRCNDRNDDAVGDFLNRLNAGGFIKVVKQVRVPTGDSGTALHNVYRLLKRPFDTPVINRDGSLGVQGLAQLHMWNVMRTIERFHALDLAVMATTDEVDVPRTTAARYARHLQDAGYLEIIRPGRGPIPRIWRLMPRMNTGPKPPKILRSKMVYDTNLETLMGTPVAKEIAA